MLTIVRVRVLCNESGGAILAAGKISEQAVVRIIHIFYSLARTWGWYQPGCLRPHVPIVSGRLAAQRDGSGWDTYGRRPFYGCQPGL